MNNKSPFQPGAFIAAYLRDSGHEDQELSVEQQEIAIQTWCIENHLVLTKLYKDAAAPGTSVVGRSAFLEMIQHFRSSDCQETGVVIWKYNRFARDIDDAQFYKADLRRRGYIIHSMNDTVPDGLDGRFFESAIDWMNARYIDDLKTDIKRGQRHILKQYGAIGGLPPRGFIREELDIGVHRDGKPRRVCRWVPDPDLIDVCIMAWKMRAMGASYREIHEATHLYNSINSYTTFFTNRLFIGELVFGEIIISDYVEPIIDKDTWETVQKINSRNVNNNNLKGKNYKHPRRRHSSFILSGLIRCAKCGAPMNGEVIVFKNKKYRYEYYACSGAQRKTGCDAKKIPRGTVEQAVIDTLYDFVLAPQNIYERQKQYQKYISDYEYLINLQQKELSKQLKDVQRKIANITEVIADQGRSVQTLVEKIIEFEQEEIKIKTKINQLTPITNIVELDCTVEHIQNIAQKYRELLDDENLPLTKQILEGLVHKIVVERDGEIIRGIIDYYYPPSDIDRKTNKDDDELSEDVRKNSKKNFLCLTPKSPMGH